MKLSPIIEEGYQQALNVLKQCISEHGFIASAEKKHNYYSVWARDHSICALASVLTNDEELINTAKKGVLYLLRKQVEHGQIPSYVEVENKKKMYGGLGSITSVDSNLWIAIAASSLYKRTKDRRFLSDTNMVRYKRLYRLFKAFDSNDCGLLEVPSAGDWADIFDRSYHILYDECLYYQSLKDLEFLFTKGCPRTNSEEIKKKIKKRIRWLKRRKPSVKRKINSTFWFTKDNVPRVVSEYMIYDKIKPKNYDYYQSHLTPFKLYWDHRFESFGNILSIITGVADKEKSNKIINYVLKKKINKPFPLKSLYPPVYRYNRDWESIYRFKERPYEYHNGGIWPLMTGLWVYVLAKNRRKTLAKRELESTSKYLKQQGWKFNEYMDGRTGKPKGQDHQAWSAASYIIAYHALKHNVSLFDHKK